MTGIGNELAHTGFTGLPRRQCGSDVVEHPVERRPELPHLGGGFASGSGTRTGSLTSPRSNGRSTTSLAVCATRRNGASARLMMTIPAVVAATNAITVTIPKMISICNIVASTLPIDRPVTMTSCPFRLGAASTRYRPRPSRSRVSGVRLPAIRSSWDRPVDVNAAREPLPVRYPAATVVPSLTTAATIGRLAEHRNLGPGPDRM